MSNKTKKQLLLNLPYFIAGLVCTNLGEAWRIAEGADMSEKLLGFLSALGAAFSNPMPSLHPMDLLIGVCCGAGLRIAVYLKGKNAKKYRHGMEYGSARWGTQKDIEPFEDPVFANNVILTRTERLMMGNRPKNPANARNKNVLVVGGSGSGKTRFWLKPNLLQCHWERAAKTFCWQPGPSVVPLRLNHLCSSQLPASVPDRRKQWSYAQQQSSLPLFCAQQNPSCVPLPPLQNTGPSQSFLNIPGSVPPRNQPLCRIHEGSYRPSCTVSWTFPFFCSFPMESA